jgi:hypothetical protein
MMEEEEVEMKIRCSWKLQIKIEVADKNQS